MGIIYDGKDNILTIEKSIFGNTSSIPNWQYYKNYSNGEINQQNWLDIISKDIVEQFTKSNTQFQGENQ